MQNVDSAFIFFLEGHFFVPLLLFFLSYSVLETLLDLTYRLVYYVLFRKLFHDLLNKNISKKEIKRQFNLLHKFISFISSKKITKEELSNLSNTSEEENEKSVIEFEKEMTSFRENLKKSFGLWFRVIIVCIMFRPTIPALQGGLFLVSLIISTFAILMIFFGDRFFSILPDLIRKVIFLCQQYKNMNEKKIPGEKETLILSESNLDLDST